MKVCLFLHTLYPTDGVVLSSNVVAFRTFLTFSWMLADGLTANSAYNIFYFNTNYTQCFTDSNDTIGITAPNNTHSLTDLQEGTEYSITVTVIVSDGGYSTDTITATTMEAG